MANREEAETKERGKRGCVSIEEERIKQKAERVLKHEQALSTNELMCKHKVM